MDFYEQMISRARAWSLPVAIMFGLVSLLGLVGYEGPQSLVSVVLYAGLSVVLFLYWLNLGKAKKYDDIEYLEKAAKMQSTYLAIMGLLSILMIVAIAAAVLLPALISR